MISHMERRARTLRRDIERIKAELAALGDLRPGSLSRQYNVCGKLTCRCKGSPPEKHGPYYQVSYTRQGRSGTTFVRRPQVATVRQQLRNYTRLRQLVDRWIEAGTELSNLRLREIEKG
jgi:Family of unknown function (DUF6788)